MLLGASFFFSRDQESRSKTGRVFFTLAYRLCFTFPQLRSRIAEALKDGSLLSSSSLRRHLRELILIPICLEAQSLSSPILVVIDALDECNSASGESSIVQFIDILASEFEALDVVPPLKIFVTSRPHEHLLRIFSRARVQDRTNMLHLRDIEASVQESDVRFFIRTRLRDLASEYGFIDNIEDWPSDEDVSDVFNLSGGLFISAATLLRMMEIMGEGAAVDPRRALDRLRGSSPRAFGLDGTYREALKMAVRCHATTKARNELTLFLAFIVLSFDRLAAPDVNALLDIKSEQFLPVLRSVIDVPTIGGPLRALHSSFHDFMVDPERCFATSLNHIDATLYHLKLAKICLRNLRILKRDLLDLHELEGKFLTEIENAEVEDRIALIPKELCYAVKYWPMHVACCATDGSITDEELLALLETFVKSGIIHWVEALSYLGYLGQAMAALKVVMSMLEVRRHLRAITIRYGC